MMIVYIEALLHKWYKTLRTQFGKPIQKKSGDGAQEYTDREKWVVTNLAFLKSQIVRVASRQAGFHRSKLGCTTSTSTPLSDDSDMDDDDDNIEIDQENRDCPSHSTVVPSTDSIPEAPKRKKRKTTSHRISVTERQTH